MLIESRYLSQIHIYSTIVRDFLFPRSVLLNRGSTEPWGSAKVILGFPETRGFREIFSFTRLSIPILTENLEHLELNVS